VENLEETSYGRGSFHLYQGTRYPQYTIIDPTM
jgi:hypothetical protein